MLHAGEKILDTLEEVLALSRLESGRVDLEPAEFDLYDLIDTVTAEMSGRAIEKSLDLAASVEPDVPRRMRGDARRVSRVLTTLLDNAFRYTETGGVTVQVDVAFAGIRADTIRFTVADTGPGMSVDRQEQLFEPFHENHGLRLGLATAKRLAELMGGRIGVETVAGGGSAFWFTARLEKLVARMDVEHDIRLAGRRVLIVDRSAASRASLARLIADMGGEAHAVETGAEALDLLRAESRTGNKFDAAIVDLRLSGMSGAQTLCQIKDDDALRGLPVIVHAARGRHDDRRFVLDHGAAVYLPKPASAARLAEAVDAAIGGGPTSWISGTTISTAPRFTFRPRPCNRISPATA
ncbi:MAG: ATP-binding protein [Deltaproteobacteria bacterium]|nr:ATP-binding protein [Deltaproteobacteria bacterium]